MAPPKRRRRYERLDLSSIAGAQFNDYAYEFPKLAESHAHRSSHPSHSSHHPNLITTTYTTLAAPHLADVSITAQDVTDNVLSDKVLPASPKKKTAESHAHPTTEYDSQDNYGTSPETCYSVHSISSDQTPGDSPRAARSTPDPWASAARIRAAPSPDADSHLTDLLALSHKNLLHTAVLAERVASQLQAPKFVRGDKVIILDRVFQDTIFEISERADYDATAGLYFYSLFGVSEKKFEERVAEDAIIKPAFLEGQQATLAGGKYFGDLRFGEMLGKLGRKVPVTIESVVCGHWKVRYEVLVTGECQGYLNQKQKQYNYIPKRVYGVEEDDLGPVE